MFRWMSSNLASSPEEMVVVADATTQTESFPNEEMVVVVDTSMQTESFSNEEMVVVADASTQTEDTPTAAVIEKSTSTASLLPILSNTALPLPLVLPVPTLQEPVVRLSQDSMAATHMQSQSSVVTGTTSSSRRDLSFFSVELPWFGTKLVVNELFGIKFVSCDPLDSAWNAEGYSSSSGSDFETDIEEGRGSRGHVPV